MKLDSPCHGCFFRESGCHSGCAKYKAFKDELRERNAAVAKLNHPYNAYRGYERAQVGKHQHTRSRSAKLR